MAKVQEHPMAEPSLAHPHISIKQLHQSATVQDLQPATNVGTTVQTQERAEMTSRWFCHGTREPCIYAHASKHMGVGLGCMAGTLQTS